MSYTPKTDRKRNRIMKLARTYVWRFGTIKAANLTPALTPKQAMRAISSLFERGELTKVKTGFPGKRQSVYQPTPSLRAVEDTGRWGKSL